MQPLDPERIAGPYQSGRQTCTGDTRPADWNRPRYTPGARPHRRVQAAARPASPTPTTGSDGSLAEEAHAETQIRFVRRRDRELNVAVVTLAKCG